MDIKHCLKKHNNIIIYIRFASLILNLSKRFYSNDNIRLRLSTIKCGITTIIGLKIETDSKYENKETNLIDN